MNLAAQTSASTILGVTFVTITENTRSNAEKKTVTCRYASTAITLADVENTCAVHVLVLILDFVANVTKKNRRQAAVMTTTMMMMMMTKPLTLWKTIGAMTTKRNCRKTKTFKKLQFFFVNPLLPLLSFPDLLLLLLPL